ARRASASSGAGNGARTRDPQLGKDSGPRPPEATVERNRGVRTPSPSTVGGRSPTPWQHRGSTKSATRTGVVAPRPQVGRRRRHGGARHGGHGRQGPAGGELPAGGEHRPHPAGPAAAVA